MPTSSGQPYELLVMGDDTYWNSSAQLALNKVINSDLLGLPQSESSFKVMCTSSKDFDNTLKFVRSIIVVKIGKRYPVAKMMCEQDLYSAPQRVLTIEAPNGDAFQRYVTKNARNIINIFTKFEMYCQILVLKHNHNEQIAFKVDSMFGCKMFVPSELHFIKTEKDFIWASTNTVTANQNFVMYSFPYSGKYIANVYNFVAKRDSVMAVNIRGNKPNSFMMTDTLEIVMKKTSTRNPFYEVRGLWRMKDDFMGGPFVSHIHIDTDQHVVYVTEVFVYVPDKIKSNFIHRLEASLYTFQSPEEMTSDKETS